MLIAILRVAFLTIFERKILSYMQYRKGLNLFRPFGDILK